MAGCPLLSYPAFVRLWIADAVSCLGMFVAALAVQFILIEDLGADQAAIGVVRSVQWLPTLLVGLVSGVWLDRMRRRPVLIAADTLSALALGAIGGLALGGVLTISSLAGLVFLVGTAAVLFNAAHQTYLPSLVPTRLLARANSRIEQTMTAAESVGPLVAGLLIRVASAPVAVLVNAVTYAISAVVMLTIREPEPRPQRQHDRHVGRDMVEGARWVYRHRTLAPYAVGLHLWFFFHSLMTTLYVFYASQGLGLGPLAIGVTLACAGVTGVVGAGLAPRAGERFGAGKVCVFSDWLTPAAYLGVFLAPAGGAGVIVLCLAFAINGVGMGLKGPMELSYRNAVTPSRLRGRMNATIRTFNWGMVAVSAPLAGFLAVWWGNRATIALAVAGLVGAACVVTFSPFRSAAMPGDDPEESGAPSSP